ncbi:quinone-dependent dihydroorotate dehydrogenase [Rhodohalobacter halophilus]|uniref:quinone-dependent dihydroorotate dehydrogenase n=1 Tax=Rhodohalobacter halophilus TaxID=1812810 RepID=UPI00083F537B|nr:quinone-dependent dihydroorotate dehydrogenase [Rhodohalobacter halophilus]
MYKFLIRPILFRLSADYAHELTVKMASSYSKRSLFLQTAGAIYSYNNPKLSQNIWGLNFKNPVGLAAGLDKNCTMAPLMEKFGFGFVEVGSVTALPSTGNPKPRSFRLPEDHSLINRLGLNNDGAQTISKRLTKLELNIPVGVNIAKTHNPEIYGDKALEDYRTSFELIKDFADYITLNVSCPNTAEGKTFEDPEVLNSLLTHLELNKDSSLPPVLVKFSVDLEDKQLQELIEVCESHAISGYVATNTSSARKNLKTSTAQLKTIGKGGLSGTAIRNQSTEIIRKIYRQTKGEKTIIGVGGISSGRDAIEKIKAGADLLQIYTSMVYEGPSIVKQINREIADYLKAHNLDHVYQIRKASDEPVTA